MHADHRANPAGVNREDPIRAARRLRASARPLAQAAIAATLAWWIAHELLGHVAPIFAPISSLIAIGASVGNSYRRTIELVIGVSIGVAVADALTFVIGHGTLQIGVIVVLAMGLAVMLNGSPTFVLQSGVAAVLIASLPSQDGAASLDRVVDTFIGGATALLMSVVVLPVRPMRLVHRAAEPVLAELAETFEQIGAGLRESDAAIAEAALVRARATGDHWAQLQQAVDIGRHAARLAPVRRHEEPVLLDIAQTVRQLDYAIRDARVMARVAWRLVETDYPNGPRLQLTMLAFADAVRALEGHLDGDYDATLRARTAAIRACRVAASAPSHEDDLVFTHLVGQVRSTTVDLLRATGLERSDAITRMLESVAEGRAHR